MNGRSALAAPLVGSLGGARLEPGHGVEIAIVGAGITGVQLAREAALRGHSVLLVDRGDLGSGTSSATTKYLHGGFRYLEQHDVGVVRQSLRERRIVALGAPHLVRQTPFVLPAWSWSRPGAALVGIGAAAYDVLSFDRNIGAPKALRIGHPRWLSKRRALAAVPWLDPTELRGAVVITDTLNIHPERLLLALARDAADHGAIVRTHAAVTGFSFAHDADGDGGDNRGEGDGPRRRVTGVELRDAIDGRTWSVPADVVVNAAGPWIAEVLAPLTPGGRRVGPRVTPSKGVHLLTKRPTGERPRRAADVAVMARAHDGRHVVVSPWCGREFIGPTDTPVAVSPSDVTADAGDIEQLLAVANACATPDNALSVDDIDDVTVGIRPLVATGDAGDGNGNNDDSATYTASRRHHLFDHADDGFPGLWTIAGGKWTTARATAEEVVDTVLDHAAGTVTHASGIAGALAAARRRSPRRAPPRSPSRRRAVGSATGFGDDPAAAFEVVGRYRRGVALDGAQRAHLARLYGLGAMAVVDLCAENPQLAARLSTRPDCHDIAAQVVVGVATEGARTLADIVDRRLVLGTLGEVTPGELQAVAAVAAPLLGWAGGGVAEAGAEHERRGRRRQRWSMPAT